MWDPQRSLRVDAVAKAGFVCSTVVVTQQTSFHQVLIEQWNTLSTESESPVSTLGSLGKHAAPFPKKVGELYYGPTEFIYSSFQC